MVVRNINFQILIKWNYIEIFVNHSHLCSMNFRNLIIWDAQLLLFVQHKFSLSFDRDAANSPIAMRPILRSRCGQFSDRTDSLSCAVVCVKKRRRETVLIFHFDRKNIESKKNRKKRRNEIGSKSDIIIGARISKIFLDYISDSWFVILKRFKLTVNEFTVLKEFRFRILRWLVTNRILFFRLFADIETMHYAGQTGKLIIFLFLFSLLFLMF